MDSFLYVKGARERDCIVIPWGGAYVCSMARCAGHALVACFSIFYMAFLL